MTTFWNHWKEPFTALGYAVLCVMIATFLATTKLFGPMRVPPPLQPWSAADILQVFRVLVRLCFLIGFIWYGVLAVIVMIDELRPRRRLRGGRGFASL